MARRIAGYVRDLPAGNALSGKAVTLQYWTGTIWDTVAAGGMHNLTTSNPVNSDANGLFEFLFELSPGPLRVRAAISGSSFKWRVGEEVMQAGEGFISDLVEYMESWTTGVVKGILNEFSAANSASTLVVTVNTGRANMTGRLLETNTTRALTHAANAGLPVRHDIIVARQHVGGSLLGKQEIAIVQGSVDGVDPTLNGDPNILELALHRVKINQGQTGNPTVEDLRVYAKPRLADDAYTSAILSDGPFQAVDAEITALSGLSSAADQLPYFTGVGTAALATFTAFARTLMDDVDAATVRATLGLGTIATQAASAVAITGGTISGITDLAVADGGTGASDAGTARTNLGLVAGGSGDIWVEKAGDTMSGALTVQGATDLQGTLNVEGTTFLDAATTINSDAAKALIVENGSGVERLSVNGATAGVNVTGPIDQTGGRFLTKGDGSSQFIIQKSDASHVMEARLDSGLRRIQFDNGTDLHGYSDDSATEKWSIDGATGNIQTDGDVNATGDVAIGGALDHNGSLVGFFGNTPGTKLTVSGSRGGNAALASLLSALASYGLITNSTTA